MGTDGLPGPSDAWVTLAGLARETSTIRLGTLMTSATFRHPGRWRSRVANVDQMSGGRVELGLGAGWFEAEHDDVRHPVPEHGGAVRPARGAARDHHRPLGDATGGFTFDGEHYRVTDSPGLPKPTQAKPPVLIGGTRQEAHAGAGRARTPTSSTCRSSTVETTTRPSSSGSARPARRCDRDPGDDALVERAGALRRRRRGRAATAGPRRSAATRTSCGENGLAGTPQEVVDKIGRYAELGAERLYLQVLDLADLDHLASWRAT